MRRVNEAAPSAQMSPAQRVGRNVYVWLLEPTIVYWSVVGVYGGILRREYVIRAEELNSKIFFDEVANNENTAVLEALIRQRNELKQEIRQRGNPIFTAWAEHRNNIKYGDKLGPNLAYLVDKQKEKHPDWTATEIRTEILKGVSRTNAGVNEGMQVVEYTAYGLAIFLVGRLLLTMSRARRGENLLAGLRVLGGWLLGGLACVGATAMAVRYASYDALLWVALGAGMGVGAVLVWVWDRIYGWLFDRLQADIKAVDKLRP